MPRRPRRRYARGAPSNPDKAGKIPGAFCHTAERAAALAKRGVRFLAVMSDLAMLRAGVGAALKVLKAG